MSAHTWTVESSAAGIPIVICRDARGAVVSKWCDSKVGILVHVPTSRRAKWVRPSVPVPQMVRDLLAQRVAA